MGTITAQSLINRVATILQDTTNTRWTREELLDWLNDGQREIVLLKPDSYTKNEAMALVEGTKQTIPAGGLVFVDLVRNLGIDGNTVGRAITVINRKILDNQRPNWHTEVLSSGYEVKHYIFDERDPKRFYIYPQFKKDPDNDSVEEYPSWYVEVIYSAAPDDVVSESNSITLDDIYANALIDYMLYRAYSKDAEYTENMQKALNAYTTFARSLGILNVNELANNPNVPQEVREKISVAGK